MNATPGSALPQPHRRAGSHSPFASASAPHLQINEARPHLRTLYSVPLPGYQQVDATLRKL